MTDKVKVFKVNIHQEMAIQQLVLAIGHIARNNTLGDMPDKLSEQDDHIRKLKWYANRANKSYTRLGMSENFNTTIQTCDKWLSDSKFNCLVNLRTGLKGNKTF